jgi:hypothetical protein
MEFLESLTAYIHPTDLAQPPIKISSPTFSGQTTKYVSLLTDQIGFKTVHSLLQVILITIHQIRWRDRLLRTNYFIENNGCKDLECKTNTIPIMMRQVLISTNQVEKSWKFG